MLRKLFKYEFKNTAKLMLTIYAVLAAMTLLGTIVLSCTVDIEKPGTGLSIFLLLLLIFYILSVFALFIVTYVYMCIHFYKTMYSDQGYLTHTLPVSSITIFHVKLVTSLVWMLLSSLLMGLSVLALMGGATHGEIFQVFGAELSKEFTDAFNMGIGQFTVLIIISIILSSLVYLLTVFTSASVGQLFHQYKVVAAIVTGIILYFFQQIASVLMMFLPDYQSIFSVAVSETEYSSYGTMIPMTSIFVSSFIYSAVICAIFYIVCVIIIKKHINLD